MSVAGYDRDMLEVALEAINRARSSKPGSPSRVEGLLEGLELVLAADPDSPDRDRDGQRALAELDRLLAGTPGEADAARIREFLEPVVDRLIDALLGRPDRRLASYGSLQPGRENHHQLATLMGRWVAGTVRGILYEDGGEPARGFPGLVVDARAGSVELQVFESAALPNHWERLDTFEGPGYRRVVVAADVDGDVVATNMYELVAPPLDAD